MMKASPKSRKSFSAFPTNDNKSKSPRRKTINAHSLSHLEDAENSVNSGNQRRYSLRSPGLKRASGVGLSNETSEFSGTGNLLNLSDFVADRLDESCFSIHSEEDKRNEATPSYNYQKKDTRRDTFDGVLNLSTSGMDTSNFSMSSGFAPTNDRRNTVDQNDISAMMRDLEDSEEDEGQSQCSLQISMSTVESAVHGVDISDLASEYNSDAGEKNKRRRSSSARSVSSVSSLGRSEAASEGTVSDLLMFSPSTPRSTRSRVASQATTPVPTPTPTPSSVRRSSAKSNTKSANKSLFEDDTASVGSVLMSAPRRSPRATTPNKTLKGSTPNFLDITNSLSLPGDASLSTSMSMAAEGAEDNTTLSQAGFQQSHTEEGDLLGLDEDSVVCDLRSARKKDDRRTTVDAADMASLLAGLDDESRDTSSVHLDTSLDASVMSQRSTRSARSRRTSHVEVAAMVGDNDDDDDDDDAASVSSVNTMQLESKISELLGADTPQNTLIGASSPTASVCDTESMDLEEAHSQASTANMSDLSLLSTASATSKASKKSRASLAKSPAKSPSKSALNKSALNQSALSFSALNKGALKSPAKSAVASPASARSSRSRAKTPEVTDSVNLSVASVASSLTGSEARPTRRDTMDPSDLGNLLDHSELDVAPSSRRNTVDPTDFMNFLDSSDLQESMSAQKPQARRETVDAASLDFLMNDSDIQEPVHNPRRETCDSIDMMSLLNSSELNDSTMESADRGDRRATMDPADMSALLNDISCDTSIHSSAAPASAKRTTETEDVLCVQDESNNGFDNFNGRPSIDMSVLQEMVANRLNDTSVLPSSSPTNSEAPSTMSFSVFSTHQQGHQSNQARRETVDPTAIADLLEEEMSVSEANIMVLSTSNLSAHSQSFHGQSQRQSQSKDTSRLSVKSTSVKVTKTAAAEEGEMELTEELTGDSRSDNGTINPADFLNDTMSTNQSFQTIATLDLQMTAEALMEEEMGYSESDAESEMTSDTLPELANFLAQNTDLNQDEVRQIQQQADSRISAASSVEPSTPHTVESPGASSVHSNASSVQSRVFTKPRTFSSPAAARSPLGGKKRRLSGGSAASTPDTPDSFDHTAELTITAELSKKVFGTRGRASLSTSVVLERPQLRNLRRASVGPIATSSSSSSSNNNNNVTAPIAPAESSASKSKAKKAKSATPELPTPASPSAGVITASALNDSNTSAIMAMAPPSALKSCLSSRKISRPGHLRFDVDSSVVLGSALKRNVVFGSPQACEFNKTSPTTNFTPLHHDHAKSLFSMAAAGIQEEDERSPDPETEENDAQMDEWERLSNASEGRWSDEDEPCEEFVDDGADHMHFDSVHHSVNQSVDGAMDSVFSSRRASMCGGKRRRDSKKMPTIDLDVDSSSDASRDLFPGSPEREAEPPRQQVPFYATSGPAELSISAEDSFEVPYVIQMEPLDASSASMDLDDVTHTVNLPDSLAELMAQNAAACTVPAPIAANSPHNVNTSTISEASHTQEIEVNLRSLMDKMSRAHYQNGSSNVDDFDDQSMVSTFSDAGSQRMSILAGFDVADLSVSMIEDHQEEHADALGALIGRESNASTIQTFAPEDEVNASLHSAAIDTSAHSVRSTRSTRSTRSSSGSAKEVSTPASVDSKASQASKASQKGRKGKKSPAAAAAQVENMEMSVHSDAPLLEMSSFAEDNTYQLEGSLAAMVNTLARTESVQEPSTPVVVASASPLVEAASTQQENLFELSMHSEGGAQSLDMSSFREEDDNTYQLEGSLAAMVNQLTAAAVVVAPCPQDISVIEGGMQEDMVCDFSALESPRPSHVGIAARSSGNDDSALLNSSTDLNESGNSRVMRRSRLSKSRQSAGGVLNISQDALNEFSLLAANEQEEDQLREMASAAPGTSIMHRLQNLNKGARNNSLLQAGTPVTRPEQSRMSIGFKRQSLYGSNNNLNSSVNMSILPNSQQFSQQSKSAVKSTKKARRNPDLSLLDENSQSFQSILSPTPSMAKVYVEAASPTLDFSNPLRSHTKQQQQHSQKELVTPGRGMLAVQVESAEEDAMTVDTDTADISVTYVNNTSTSTSSEVDTSLLNETTTDYVPIVANLRNKLHSFFSAVQTVKTVLSTYSTEIRTIVQSTMETQIEAAYVDSPLQYVPLEALLLAWSMLPTESEQYAQHVVDRYPQSYRQQRLVHPDQHHDQLWVNMCAKTIIDHTAALKRAQAAQQAEEAQSNSQADRFYNKALNRDPTLKPSASADFSAMLTAQQAQTAAQVKRSLQETEMLIDIVNKLTYCRVTTFTSSCVRISAMLSATVTAELTFQLKRSTDSANQVVLTIQNVLVDLAIKQDKSTPQVTQAQNLFVTAYFASVMCSDELEGCLSQTTLLAAAEPSDIPALLQKISGSIAELRWALLRLSTLSGGYKCTVAKTTAEQGGFKALVTLPSLHAQQKKGVLHVSVRNFVSACHMPSSESMEGFVVREGSNEEIVGEEREEMLSQLQVRLDSCLPR